MPSHVLSTPASPPQINSTSPLSTPPLTSLHLNTHTSPLFNSTTPTPASPCTSTRPASLNTRTNTAPNSSGTSTILTFPALSSNPRIDAGNAARNDAR
ncbi:hypothetical protein Tdes44962_MAKER04169 [Teratosphaeria destructans]|uniref:Uncharacterized protein n=1 Tax=Teratosphaeria destructans TaxID=418781 RepID=A0A9W7SN07_9PEZI|nr:hypothetical protein Tdes44962_MAKER04169 [Teratosphaeria destructans]